MRSAGDRYFWLKNASLHANYPHRILPLHAQWMGTAVKYIAGVVLEFTNVSVRKPRVISWVLRSTANSCFLGNFYRKYSALQILSVSMTTQKKNLGNLLKWRVGNSIYTVKRTI